MVALLLWPGYWPLGAQFLTSLSTSAPWIGSRPESRPVRHAAEARGRTPLSRVAGRPWRGLLAGPCWGGASMAAGPHHAL